MNDDLYTLDEQYFSRKIFIIWSRKFFFISNKIVKYQKGRMCSPKNKIKKQDIE